MKNLRDRKLSPGIFRELLFPILVFLAIAGVLGWGIYYVGSMNRQQNLDLLRQTVSRTTVQCYAIEGLYPPDVEYLEENYNLSYDHDAYFIFYDSFASNIMPVIEVYEKK